MNCHKCGKPTKVRSTQIASEFPLNRAKAIATVQPQAKARRRGCPKCGTYVTIELPIEDVEDMLGMDICDLPHSLRTSYPVVRSS